MCRHGELSPSQTLTLMVGQLAVMAQPWRPTTFQATKDRLEEPLDINLIQLYVDFNGTGDVSCEAWAARLRVGRRALLKRRLRLPSWWDVDEVQDLERLRELLAREAWRWDGGPAGQDARSRAPATWHARASDLTERMCGAERSCPCWTRRRVHRSCAMEKA